MGYHTWQQAKGAGLGLEVLSEPDLLLLTPQPPPPSFSTPQGLPQAAGEQREWEVKMGVATTQ